MSRYTKGPWSVGKANGFVNQLTIDPSIGCVYGAGEEVLANARLIAAAPDLLEALQSMVVMHDEPCSTDHHGCCQEHFLDDVNNGGCRVANAKLSIAKARGQL